MTPEQFRAALHVMCWTPSTVAGQLGVSYSLVRRWAGLAKPPAPIPPEVAAWMRELVKAVERVRPPEAIHAPAPQPIRWKRTR